jgi:hypothetical protein
LPLRECFAPGLASENSNLMKTQAVQPPTLGLMTLPCWVFRPGHMTTSGSASMKTAPDAMRWEHSDLFLLVEAAKLEFWKLEVPAYVSSVAVRKHRMQAVQHCKRCSLQSAELRRLPVRQPDQH